MSLMHRRIAAAAALLALGAPAPARSQDLKPPPGDAEVFLDLSKVQLGPVTSTKEKDQFLYTVQLEKSRMTRHMLEVVYDNAFQLYQSGDFKGARELTKKILDIDPNWTRASMLYSAATTLQGSRRPGAAENRFMNDRFQEGMVLYRDGQLAQAEAKWKQAVELSPYNLKVRYWLHRVRHELAGLHFERGERAWRQHRLSDALDQWYSALVLDPRYPRLAAVISQAESDHRKEVANHRLQEALALYGEGKIPEALSRLDAVLAQTPGNPRVERLMGELRHEMADQHLDQGRRYYGQRRYAQAISEFKIAVKYGYDPGTADALIAQVLETKIREKDEAVAAAKARKKRQEQKAKAESEEAKKEEDLKKKELAPVKPAPVAPVAISTGPAVITPEAKRLSQQHYFAGIIAFQKGDYQEARRQWTLAKQYDPSNSDAQAGLERIDRIYSEGGP